MRWLDAPLCTFHPCSWRSEIRSKFQLESVWFQDVGCFCFSSLDPWSVTNRFIQFLAALINLNCNIFGLVCQYYREPESWRLSGNALNSILVFASCSEEEPGGWSGGGGGGCCWRHSRSNVSNVRSIMAVTITSSCFNL